MTAPYEERDGWEMNVMVVDGTMYLEEHLTDDKLKEKLVSVLIVSLPYILTDVSNFQE
jgi:hypothetical protein